MKVQCADHKRALHRLKIAAGQLANVISMVENDAYCIDIIYQSRAVQKALRGVDELLLENHLESCVVEKCEKGEIDEALQEVMAVIRTQE